LLLSRERVEPARQANIREHSLQDEIADHLGRIATRDPVAAEYVDLGLAAKRDLTAMS
jgi:hypothetical protein